MNKNVHQRKSASFEPELATSAARRRTGRPWRAPALTMALAFACASWACGDAGSSESVANSSSQHVATEPNIFGIHDLGGEGLFQAANRAGWTLSYQPIDEVENGSPNLPASLMTGEDLSSTRVLQTSFADVNAKVVVRIDHAWQLGRGVLPCESRDAEFIQQIVAYVSSPGMASVSTFVIANETNVSPPPNLSGAALLDPSQNSTTWPRCGADGHFEAITPERYARFFTKLAVAVHAVRPDAKLIPSPAAPQIYGGVHGVDYEVSLLDAIAQLSGGGSNGVGGIALHAYTQDHDAREITSEDTEATGAGPRHRHFRVYQDSLSALPGWARALPVYITEAAPWSGPTAWTDKNDGWIQAMFAEVDRWNATSGTQKINAAFLYHWGAWDFAGFENKPYVIADLRAALTHDYRVNTQVAPPPSPQPSPSPAQPPASSCACRAGTDNFCLYPASSPGCAMTAPGGYCDPNRNGQTDDADWVRGYQEYQAACSAKPLPPAQPCACRAGTDNYCLYPMSTPGCSMTAPGGYCDPDGNGWPNDADWTRGYNDYKAACSQ